MLSVSGTRITLTKGDSARIGISITTKSGETYTPKTGDQIRFYLKRDIKASNVMLEKEIDISDMLLNLRPDDTKQLATGNYVYDIELTKTNGDVDTFINAAQLTILAEVG